MRWEFDVDDPVCGWRSGVGIERPFSQFLKTPRWAWKAVQEFLSEGIEHGVG
jgi:hypothetical protein